MARSASLHGYYSLHFAGRPRATRDLVAAEMLVTEAKEIAAMAAETQNAALRDQATERVTLYETERSAILDAHALGLDAARAVIVGTRANLVFARYRRHFSGQDRRSRDLALLDELIDDCEGLQRSAAELVVARAPEGLRKDLEIITENLSLYRRERTAVAEARDNGTPEARASTLADLANRQFQLYALHFSGKDRMSRRAGLLKRIMSALNGISDGMGALSAQGEGGEATMKNAGIVGERLGMYKGELAQLEALQTRSTAFQRLHAVEAAASTILSEYNREFAGQDRATRDPDKLSILCDAMGEVERQLTALVDRFNLGVRHRPTARIRDLAVMLEREHEAVLKARLN